MSGIPAGAGSLLGKHLGKFEILALLALGGTAEIYLARIAGAAGFEKYVVVKCLHDHLADDPEFVRMFLDEARLAAHLDHSNIVQTMELGEHENRYYMVMEFLAGLSLAMVVRRAGERLVGGRIPVPLVLNMMSQACAGLHYAHEKALNGKALNIVHRDVSPQNLVISFEGVVKVVDFGIAKAELRETKTRSGTIKGKFAYMSPEQCIATNVDRRTDVFALGVIAHELLTGRRLFKRNSPYETYQAVIECVVDPPSKMNVELDPTIDEIIMRAITRVKEDRYPTAEAFGDALQRYMHSRGKGSGPGEVSRFFDATFAQEIEEHATRMRELIQGREPASADTGVTWGAGDEEAKRLETLELSRRRLGKERSRTDDTVDLGGARPNAGSISDVINDLGAGSQDREAEVPADRTRIETNPLERIADDEAMLDQQAKRASQAKPTTQFKPQPVHEMPPSGPLPLPTPLAGPAGQVSKASLAKFPELANLPTMIAEPDREAPELSPTQLGAKLIEERIANDAQNQANGVAPPRPSAPAVPLGPTGYPVMNPLMSAQMMSGNIYPSDRSPRHLAPPAMHDSPPRLAPESAPVNAPAPNLGHPQSPQQAASLMSPVGPHSPEQAGWAQTAVVAPRVPSPWMLAVLFVAASGIALTVTILLTKIVR